MSRFSTENVSHTECLKALEENLTLLDRESTKAVRNLTLALVYLVRTQTRLSQDVDLLHRKLQPILKYLEEENNDWRDRFSQFGDL